MLIDKHLDFNRMVILVLAYSRNNTTCIFYELYVSIVWLISIFCSITPTLSVGISSVLWRTLNAISKLENWEGMLTSPRTKYQLRWNLEMINYLLVFSLSSSFLLMLFFITLNYIFYLSWYSRELIWNNICQWNLTKWGKNNDMSTLVKIAWVFTCVLSS